MDTLIWTIVVGLATAFVVEFLNNTVGSWIWWLSPRAVRLWLTIPIAFGATLLLGVPWPSDVVVTLAAGFFSNALLLLLERASIVNIRR
jgi:hypothetical protein